MVSGRGIAQLPAWLVGDDVRSGTLVHVLPKWLPAPLPIWVVFPPSRHRPRRVRAFVDALIQDAESVA
ncbi:MAG: LysR substrate-binding domain-containing protein [Myxococcota bacterium]